MISRGYTLTLLRPDGSTRQEMITGAESERKVMTPIRRSWISASVESLEGLFVMWGGVACPSYVNSAAPRSEALFNPAATDAHAEFLRGLPTDAVPLWSPADGKAYGTILIIEDRGLIKHSPPNRSSEELAAHDWFGLSSEEETRTA